MPTIELGPTAKIDVKLAPLCIAVPPGTFALHGVIDVKFVPGALMLPGVLMGEFNGLALISCPVIEVSVPVRNVLLPAFLI
jgi:hypothetical protein